MRLTIVHNPRSGDGALTGADLITLVSAAGHQAVYASTEEPAAVAAALAEPAELVVVAGGDGTFRNVARRVIGRHVALTMLPMGTANNIGRSLGITAEPAALVDGWHAGRHQAFDTALVRGCCGPRIMLEGAGIGPIASTIAALSRLTEREARAEWREDELRRDVKVLREMIADGPTHACRIALDGRDLSGEYLAVEVMNIRSIGPNVELAPGADCSDGLFDLVLVAGGQRAELRDYLTARLEGKDDAPWLTSHRGRDLRVEWPGSRVHVDDEIWPGERDASHGVCWPPAVHFEVRVSPDPLTVLVPGR